MQEIRRGRALARALIEQVAVDAARAKAEIGRNPTLAIVAGDDDDSRRFVQIKQTALADVALDLTAMWLPHSAKTDDALRTIEELNHDAHVDAVFLQFPLPRHIDAQRAANAVETSKDIDCSSEAAEARFLAEQSPYVPVAPHAALDLLTDHFKSLGGRHMTIGTPGDAFGRALSALLRRADAVISPSLTDTDALIVSDALPDLSRVQRIDILLDAGYYLAPRPSGWIPGSAADRIALYLTQYGNVGPLTVAHLAAETIKASQIPR